MNRRVLLALLLALTASLVSTACGSTDKGLDLKDSVRAYNQRLRWNAFEAASAFVAAEKRATWLASRAGNAAGLHFTDIQVVRLQQPNPDEKSVDVLVAFSWYRLPETTVQSALWAQTWQEDKGRWHVIDERVVDAKEAPPPAEQWP